MKKGTLAAIGVFAGLLLLFLATRERQVSEGITKLDLPGLEKDKVSSLEISGTPATTLRKDGESWVVVDPARADAKYPADESQVRSALESLPQLKSAELVTERAEKHAEFEVDDAHGRKMRLLGGSGSATELIFGKAARAGTYVRKAGSNAVFVTESSLGWMARREPGFWRKHEFMSLKPEDISQVTVRPAGSEPYTLKAGDGGAWTLAEPAQPPAGFRFDTKVAPMLVQQLATLAAQDFAQGMSDDAAGLAGTHDVIEARLKGGKTVTLHLGTQAATKDSQGLVPVRKEGDAQIYLVPSSVALLLRKKLTELRDMTLLNFDWQKVTRLSIQAGGKKTVVTKDGSNWKVTQPETLPVGFEFDPRRVNAQLTRLQSIHASRWLEPAVNEAAAGLGKPSAVVELTLEGGGSQSLRFGKETTSPTGVKEYFIKGSADAAVYAIPIEQRASFEAGVELFKKLPAPPQATAAVQGLDSLPPELRKQIEAQLRNASPHP